jgi:hypothetical protein
MNRGWERSFMSWRRGQDSPEWESEREPEMSEALVERCKRSILERLSELGLLDAPDDDGERGG